MNNLGKKRPRISVEFNLAQLHIKKHLAHMPSRIVWPVLVSCLLITDFPGGWASRSFEAYNIVSLTAVSLSVVCHPWSAMV